MKAVEICTTHIMVKLVTYSLGPLSSTPAISRAVPNGRLYQYTKSKKARNNTIYVSHHRIFLILAKLHCQITD